MISLSIVAALASTPATKPPVASQYGAWDSELLDGCGGLSSAVIDVARLVAMFSDRTGNPVLSAAAPDSLFAAAAEATSTLSGPDVHGYHGFDWAVVDDAANKVYRASKGGYLPGQGTGATFMTGGFGIVIAQNGNPRPSPTPPSYDPVTKAAQAHAWSDEDLFVSFGMPSLTAQTFLTVPIVDVEKLSSLKAEQQVRASIVRDPPWIRQL